MQKISKSWWVLTLLSLGVIIPFMAPYFMFDPAQSRVPITSTTVQYPLLVSHIMTAFLALITGFLQFIDRIRIKHPRLHRLLGRVYVYSVFISGTLSLAIVYYAENYTKAIAFLVLALFWLYTCWKGYRTAVKKEYEEHRKWMIRSFGFTLVAVSGRLVVPVLLLLYYLLNGFSLPHGREAMIEEVLNVNIWVALMLNVAIVEWGILKSGKRRSARITD
ncbi:DUF2306 domain-containing protein [Brevibacillus migulae]|uniref:DUF2306 domain-containing protein n=1 Tax=Brevibacillus migulae TaxID=1644114 RepID=UPI00106E39A3|nr:DUF2306 domain-containing protein [Brevibacillus migulae]